MENHPAALFCGSLRPIRTTAVCRLRDRTFAAARSVLSFFPLSHTITLIKRAASPFQGSGSLLYVLLCRMLRRMTGRPVISGRFDGREICVSRVLRKKHIAPFLQERPETTPEPYNASRFPLTKRLCHRWIVRCRYRCRN